tara:strand:+ start:706 stop:1356 length:651 start_codon:yes stop_codon:yes gene_type:complete
MNYPITIVDNFFEDADAILDMANSYEFYFTDDGRWPGSRTNQIFDLNRRFYNYLNDKIHLLHYEKPPEYTKLSAHFQKIEPLGDSQWDKRNQGWIHQDYSYFGGIIFLNKNPSPDSGTSIYKAKNGYVSTFNEECKCKRSLYLGEEINLDKYNEAWNNNNDQYIETVTVQNVYNRLLMFNGNTHHGVKTFGTQARLTLNFFGLEMAGSTPPLLRIN